MFISTRKRTVLIAITLASAALVLGCQKRTEVTRSSAPQPSSTTAAGDADAPPTSDAAAGTDPELPQPSDTGAGSEPAAPQPAEAGAGGDAKPPQRSCTVDEADFAKWFKDGKVTKDGFVTAADSLQSLDTLCDFYKWSWRMFLWQMSTTSDGGLVFHTAPFFDLDDNNVLISNKSGAKMRKYLRGGKLESTDRTGQAGIVSGVLMAQSVGEAPDGSLVYYGIHVNDVYAYMASGVNSKELTGVTQFPITAEERDVIVKYAKEAYNVDIDDANSLALELKSSWIKADDSMDLQEFITIKSDIPQYTQDNDKKWTWDGQTLEEDVTLACVGYHLVGSASNHPEMIWATFEHSKNAPDANYYYVADDGEVTLKKNWNADGTPIEKDWIFMDGTSKEQSMNQMRMEMKGKEIVATPDNTIGPGNTMRTHPWGGAPDTESATNNTAIIAININIASMLAEGDVRGNYFLGGATWTKNGVPGVGLQIPEVAGSLTLSNTTMETYFQYKNCFDCHKGGELNGLSHIFGAIKPLAKPVR